MTYDSANDTFNHIARVQGLLFSAVENLTQRAMCHDASKLSEPEKSTFDAMTPRLRELEYGSDEYKACLAEMQTALEHHYAHNAHHPQHYENGLTGMSLLDLLEMICDWKAAGERHATGSMQQSLDVNKTRFGMSPQLHTILVNTAREMGWIE